MGDHESKTIEGVVRSLRQVALRPCQPSVEGPQLGSVGLVEHRPGRFVSAGPDMVEEVQNRRLRAGGRGPGAAPGGCAHKTGDEHPDPSDDGHVHLSYTLTGCSEIFSIGRGWGVAKR